MTYDFYLPLDVGQQAHRRRVHDATHALQLWRVLALRSRPLSGPRDRRVPPRWSTQGDREGAQMSRTSLRRTPGTSSPNANTSERWQRRAGPTSSKARRTTRPRRSRTCTRVSCYPQQSIIDLQVSTPRGDTTSSPKSSTPTQTLYRRKLTFSEAWCSLPSFLPYLKRGEAMLFNFLVPLAMRSKVTLTDDTYVQRTRGSKGAHY